LGESAVFGYGLNDDQTWPHLLEDKLRRRLDDPALDVVNAGNNGHTSLQTLFRFYARVLPRKPTDVVLYVGPNDLYGRGPDRLLISEDILFNGSVAQFWAAATRGENLYARSLLFYVMQQYVPALGGIMRRDGADKAETPPEVGPPGETPSQEFQRLQDTIGGAYIENIRTICLISRSKGITPILVTFMQNMERRPPLLLEHNNTLLRALAAEQGIALIDVAEAFAPVGDKASYFFADHYHPNPKGAEFIASVIADRWPEKP
jgi:lysophospholipase L1-like esterase